MMTATKRKKSLSYSCDRQFLIKDGSMQIKESKSLKE